MVKSICATDLLTSAKSKLFVRAAKIIPTIGTLSAKMKPRGKKEKDATT